MYPQELVTALEEELIAAGFVPFKTAEVVKDHMQNAQGTTLLFVNSVCGCAGTGARMGTLMALQAVNQQPDHLMTVFAGVDDAAAEQVFEYTKPYPPSSPAIALFKDGVLVYFMERHQIKGNPPELIAAALQEALEACCEAQVVS
ncbi:MAG: BrxA/BrxB family bacilliredoxin [Bacteroidota bacterium]